MKKHFSTLILLLLVIGLIMGCGYSLKLVISRGNQIAALQQENQDLKQAIAELNNKVEDLQDSQVIQKTENVIEKTEVRVVPVLDTTKISNLDEGVTLTERIYDSNNIISISAENASSTVTISLNADMARQVYGYNGQSDTHTIAGFSEKIADAKIMTTGTTSNDVKVMLLMADGTVKYIPMTAILDQSYTVQTVPDLTNVVKLSEVNISKDNTTSFGIVALKADGTAIVLKW